MFLKSFLAHSHTKSHANRSTCVCVCVCARRGFAFFFFLREARVLRECGVLRGEERGKNTRAHTHYHHHQHGAPGRVRDKSRSAGALCARTAARESGLRTGGQTCGFFFAGGGTGRRRHRVCACVCMCARLLPPNYLATVSDFQENIFPEKRAPE